jgi:rod shape-determining protein MreC
MLRQRRPYYLFAVFVLPLLVILQSQKVTEPLRSFSLTLLKPALIAGDSAAGTVTGTRDFFVRIWKAFQNQEVYERRIGELENEVRLLQEAGKENERLMKIFNFRKTFPEKSIAAKIIGWDISPWRKTVILDKGTKHGLRKDMAVIVPEGLAGRVYETGPETSRVILLTDPDSRVSAAADQSRAQGVIAGDGSSRLKMTFLELESGIAVEETVLTSGSGLYPKGLRVGKVTGLNKDSTGLHLEAKIQSFVQFSKLEEVLCLASSPAK